MGEKIVILDFDRSTRSWSHAACVNSTSIARSTFQQDPWTGCFGASFFREVLSVRDEKAPEARSDGDQWSSAVAGRCYGAQYLAYFYGGEVQSAPAGSTDVRCLRSSSRPIRWMQGVPTPTQVDVARRYDYLGSRHLPGDRQHGGRALCRLPYWGESEGGYSVPSEAYHSTDGITPFRISGRNLRLQTGLDAGEFRRNDRPGIAWEVGRRPCSARSFRRCRFVGGCRAAAPGDRQKPYCIFVDSGLCAERVRQRAGIVKGWVWMSRVSRPTTGFWATWPEWPIPRRSARSSAAISWRCSMPRPADRERKVAGAGYDLSRRGGVRFGIGQGTCRDDSESHHNVGGLPEEMHLKIVEPLRRSLRTRCAAW